ncbi:hypothetical protein RintRC_3501 [Richelia intracellularis]|nr:hypothetical protein RintRC_3501 [Richelia intracellularis]
MIRFSMPHLTQLNIQAQSFPALLNQGMISLNFQRFINAFKR